MVYGTDRCMSHADCAPMHYVEPCVKDANGFQHVSLHCGAHRRTDDCVVRACAAGPLPTRASACAARSRGTALLPRRYLRRTRRLSEHGPRALFRKQCPQTAMAAMLTSSPSSRVSGHVSRRIDDTYLGCTSFVRGRRCLSWLAVIGGRAGDRGFNSGSQ